MSAGRWLLAAALVCAGLARAGAEEGNLLANPGFEKNAKGRVEGWWSGVRRGAGAVSFANGDDGPLCRMQAEAPARLQLGTKLARDLPAGQPVELSIEVRGAFTQLGETEAHGAGLVAEILGPSGGPIRLMATLRGVFNLSAREKVPAAAPGGFPWTKLSLTFIPPRGTKEIAVLAYLFNAAGWIEWRHPRLASRPAGAKVDFPLPEAFEDPVGKYRDALAGPFHDVGRARPALLLCGQSVADLRRKAALPEWAPLIAQLKKDAERILAEPDPKGRSIHEWRSWGARIQTTALLYLLTGEERFLAKAKDLTLKLAARTDHRDPVHQGFALFDIACGEVAFTLGLAYDWLYPQWTPAERDRIRGCFQNVLVPRFLAETNDGKGMTRQPTNWGPVCSGGMITGLLALRGEHPGIDAVIARARANLEPFLAGWKDGASDEGITYWGYGMFYLWSSLTALRDATGRADPVLAQPIFRDSGLFPVMNTPNGVNVGFGDSWPSSPLSPVLYLMERDGGHRNYTPFLQRDVLAEDGSYHAALAFEPKKPQRYAVPWLFLWALDNQPAATPDLPRVKAWEQSAFVAAADRWPAPTRFLAVHTGEAGANLHLHYDFGSFQYLVGREFIFCDLGPALYNTPGYFNARTRPAIYKARTEDHNTLTIDGHGQGWKQRAPLSYHGARDGLATWTVDLGGSYGIEDGGFQLKRHFIWVMDTGEFAVIDRLESPRPRALASHWHTGARLAGEGSQWTFTGSTARAALTFAADQPFETAAAPSVDPATGRPAPDTVAITRLTEKFAPATSLTAAALIVPENQPSGQCAVQGGQVRLTFPLSQRHLLVSFPGAGLEVKTAPGN